MRTFITGSKGQLGAEFVRLFEAKVWNYAKADIDTLDLTDPHAVQAALMNFKPSLILNCAAYNLVDKAEVDPAPAYAVNADAVSSLAEVAMKLKSKFVHFGTDYVFDGSKTAPYTENDKENPLNYYGRSKLQGEEFALTVPHALVFRLSWVYGRGTQNFMHKLLGWAKNPTPLRVAVDEKSVPTGVVDIVPAVMDALKSGLDGRWHLTASGHCSRFEWASTILRACGVDKEIMPARMADFNMTAPRPLFSVMSNAALCCELGIKIPHWQEAVEKFIGNKK
jgi:dTDP-4-dehydrorhamnose reductase